MKRTTFLVTLVATLVVLSILLTGCKANSKTAKATEPAFTPKFDYQSVVVTCETDTLTEKMICSHIKQGDSTFIDSIISEQVSQGWDLVTVFPDKPHYTLIFKKDHVEGNEQAKK